MGRVFHYQGRREIGVKRKRTNRAEERKRQEEKQRRWDVWWLMVGMTSAIDEKWRYLVKGGKFRVKSRTP